MSKFKVGDVVRFAPDGEIDHLVIAVASDGKMVFEYRNAKGDIRVSKALNEDNYCLKPKEPIKLERTVAQCFRGSVHDEAVAPFDHYAVTFFFDADSRKLIDVKMDED